MQVKALISVVLLLLVCSHSIVRVQADESPPITFLGEENYAPLEYYDKGVPTGLNVALLHALSKAIDREIKIELMRWNTAQRLVLDGQADALSLMSITPERKRLYDFSEPTLTLEYSIFFRSDEPPLFKVADLKGRSVGVTVGGLPHQILKDNSDIELVVINNQAEGFELLISGTIDAMATNKWVGAYLVQKNDIEGVAIAGLPFATQIAAIAVRKGNTELLDEINRGIQQLSADGTTQKILEKWVPKTIVFLTRETIRKAILIGVIVSLLVIIALALLWIVVLRKTVRYKTKLLQTAHDELEERVVERTVQLEATNRDLRKEINERERVEQALKYHFKLEQLVSQISTRFVDFPSESIDTSIEQALEAISRFARADEGYLFRFSEDGDKVSCTYHWRSAKLNTDKHFLQELDTHRMPWWMNQLRRGEVVLVPSVDDLPEEASLERSIILSQGVQSLVDVPMIDHGKIIGFLGFSSVVNNRSWSDDELGLLKIVGEVFTNALQRDRAAKAVRASEDKFAKAFRSCPDAVAITSLSDGRFLEINDGFEQITGYERDEVLGRTSHELSLWVDSQARAELVQALQDHGSVRDVEFDVRRKSGEVRTCQVSAELANIADVSCMVSVTKDITERMERESQLFQAQKMETVGQLTGGIAHDFNNLLTVIRGNLRLLQEDLKSEPEDDIRELIDDALSATDDGEELTQRLLSFSRRKSLAPRRLDVNRVIEDFRRLVRRTLGENIQLELNLFSGVAVASVDRGHLESALLNLAINARDAMPLGGSLVIETDRKTLVRDALVEFPGLEIGRYVTITVSDTGTGMEAEVVAKACEPFFTTKEPDKGSGLGLSMVYDFAKRSGGALLISSIPAQGTDVTMLLPESSSDIEEDRRSDHKPTLPRGHETVLVVEDRPEVRRFAVRSLESQGYRVLQASDGMDAMKVLEADNSIEVLFSDVIMPGGMNGDELAKRALKQFPHIKILLTTASSSENQETMSSHGDDIHWLRKPYSKDELAQRIRAVLDTGIHRV